MRTPIRTAALAATGALFALAVAGCAPSDNVETPDHGATNAPHGDDSSTTPDSAPKESTTNVKPTFYSGEVTALDGSKINLADYAGKTTLVVNVASRCGYTPQYAGLQELHEKLGGKEDFAILAFPSNDFGGQEPGTNEEIQQFCSSKFGVEFQMFDKVATKGDGASKVYDKLAEMTGERPGWNFCKYVVSPDGTQAKFFKSNVKPSDASLLAAIEGYRGGN